MYKGNKIFIEQRKRHINCINTIDVQAYRLCPLSWRRPGNIGDPSKFVEGVPGFIFCGVRKINEMGRYCSE